jgi:hypothetical protein
MRSSLERKDFWAVHPTRTEPTGADKRKVDVYEAHNDNAIRARLRRACRRQICEYTCNDEETDGLTDTTDDQKRLAAKPVDRKHWLPAVSNGVQFEIEQQVQEGHTIDDEITEITEISPPIHSALARVSPMNLMSSDGT